jgi:SAM-dependent methyltransferase
MVAAAWRNITDPAGRLQVASFEDLADTGPFDLIVSATAFHWVDPGVGLAKAARLLRPGGWLALLTTGERYPEPLQRGRRELWTRYSRQSEKWADQPAVIGLFIWARIDDQRHRSFVTGYPGRPPGFQDHEDIRGRMPAGRRHRVAVGGQTSLPWRLSRSVIDSVGLAGAEFAPNDAESGAGSGGRAQHRSRRQNVRLWRDLWVMSQPAPVYEGSLRPSRPASALKKCCGVPLSRVVLLVHGISTTGVTTSRSNARLLRSLAMST